jgi:WD40 repeat protein
MAENAKNEEALPEKLPVSFRTLPSMRGFDFPATAVAHSPLGSLILSGGEDGSLLAFDPTALSEVGEMVGHAEAVTGLDVDSREERFASSSKDRCVRIWDFARLDVLHQMRAFQDEVSDVAFSPDGEQVAASSHDKTVAIFEAATGKELHRLELDVPLTSVSYHPGGKRLFVGAANSVIHVFSTETWEAEGKPLKGSHGNWVTSVACSADGKVVASGCQDTSVSVWDLKRGKEKASFKGGRRWVQAVQVAPEGDYLFAGGRDGSVVVMNLGTGEQEAVLRSREVPINDISIFLRGTRLAAACEDGSIQCFVLRGMEWSAWSPGGTAVVAEGEAEEGATGPNPAYYTNGAFDYAKWKGANPQLFG